MAVSASGSPSPGIILASASPRRRRLLDLIGLPHRVIPAGIDEAPRPGEDPRSLAERSAREKASAVAARHPRLPVLGADTVVEAGGRMLGKPRSRDEARAMLELLSGASHRVHTGLALALDGRCASLVETATVSFVPLTTAQIDWYLDTGEPMDKAGAYAIQGCGGLFVRGIDGSPHTVVGLPVHALPGLFARLGVPFWDLLATGRG